MCTFKELMVMQYYGFLILHISSNILCQENVLKSLKLSKTLTYALQFVQYIYNNLSTRSLIIG